MVHEDNPDIIWSHSVKSTISKVRSMANAIANVRDGASSISDLSRIENRLWEIAKELDNHSNELFVEIKRLRQQAGES